MISTSEIRIAALVPLDQLNDASRRCTPHTVSMPIKSKPWCTAALAAEPLSRVLRYIRRKPSLRRLSQFRTQFQLLLGDVAESLEHFGAFKGTAGCTTQGVVGQTHELPIEDGILTQTADGNAHATLVVHVELDLRAVILGEVLDEVLRCVRQLQLGSLDV